MDRIRIVGGSKLNGTIAISGAKNAALPLMIAALLVYTRSLGACIIAHGVTNFLLGGYVLFTKNWYFW